MSEVHRKRVEELFAEAIDLPPEGRSALLAMRCVGNAALRAEVESLLGHAPDAIVGASGPPGSSFLDPDELRGQRGVLGLEQESLAASTRIAEFTILGKIGEGGMGVVYLAEQARPRRTVALKLIRRGLATPAMTRRFEHEAEVLGRLAHPGIAQIYEAGVAPTPSGVQPYIAMERIDGPPITEYAASNRLTLTEKLRMMVRVCEAVQHAHQRGVIHRDLKPSNILVAAGTEQPQPKVLDFGVARVTLGSGDGAAQPELTSLHTGIGQFIGTLAYMSPEQVLADSSLIDTRSDVYSLGVILFELIAGRLPIDVRGKSMPEAARLIREADPTRLTTIDRTLGGDLATVVSRALEKDRERRYASASELGDEIRRFLEGRPILAKQDSALYVLRKQLMRHRWAGMSTAAALIALLSFTGYAWWQSRVQQRLAQSEREARKDADKASAAAKERSEALRKNLYVSAIGFAQAAYASSDAERMRRVLDSCPEDLRGWEWRYLHRISDVSVRSTPLPADGLASMAGSRDGSKFIGWYITTPIVVYDTADWREIGRCTPPAFVSGAVVSDDGKTCVFGCADGSVRTGDTSSGTIRILTPPGPTAIAPIALSADGAMVLIGFGPTVKRTARFVDVRTGATVRELPGLVGFSGAFSPDGRLAALGSEDGFVRICDLSDMTAELRQTHVHVAGVRALTFNHAGTRLASGGLDGLVGVLDLSDMRSVTIPVTENKVFGLAWSPDDALIAASGTEPVVRVVNPAVPRVLSTLFGHRARVDVLGWTKNGGLVSTAKDSSARWWGVGAPPTVSRSFDTYLPTACFDPHGRWCYVGFNSGGILALDPADLHTLFELSTGRTQIVRMITSPDGRRLAATLESGEMIVFDTESRSVLLRVQLNVGQVSSLSWNAAGDAIALVSEKGQAQIISATTGDLVKELPALESPACAVQFSPDGSLLAIAHRTGIILLHNPADGRVIREVRGHDNFVFAIRFTPDGKWGCSGDENGEVHVWDPATGALRSRMLGHHHGVFVLGVSPDGSRIASGGWDNTVRVWKLDDGQELLTLRGHASGIYGADFSPDGETLFTVSGEGLVRLWASGVKPAP